MNWQIQLKESLAQQMAGMSISNNSSSTGEALFTHRKKNSRFEKSRFEKPKFEKEEFQQNDDFGSGESSSHYKKKNQVPSM